MKTERKPGRNIVGTIWLFCLVAVQKLLKKKKLLKDKGGKGAESYLRSSKSSVLGV